MSEQAWVKSSYSGSEANCVEVAVRGRVAVRDIMDRTGPVLRFTPAAWRAFACQVKVGNGPDLSERSPAYVSAARARRGT